MKKTNSEVNYNAEILLLLSVLLLLLLLIMMISSSSCVELMPESFLSDALVLFSGSAKGLLGSELFES